MFGELRRNLDEVPAHARGERQKLWKIYLNLTSSRTREGA